MRDLEFFRNVSIGRYVAGSSYIHRLTPATKYLWLAALALPAMVAQGWPGIAAPLAAALVLAPMAGLRPFFLVRSLRPLLPLLAVVAILQCVFSWPGDESAVLLRLGPIAATAFEAGLAAAACARAAALVVVVGLFTSVTSASETAHGIEDALAPLSAIGVPAHRLALAVAAAFRFVPIVAAEMEAIAKAQASRGANFGSGRGGPIAKACAYLPLFVPVVVRSLERAELLAEAMEARCYAGEARQRYVVYRAIIGEGYIRIAGAAFCAGALALGFLV